jgi:hypothetical protein
VLQPKDSGGSQRFFRVFFVARIKIEECRVNFRWGSTQLEMVKQVAKTMGVSYQQYIKQVVYRQAYADLQSFSTPQEARGQESRRVTKENARDAR